LRLALICAVLLVAAPAGALPAGAAPLEPAVARMLESLSLPVPDPPKVLVCHGFGCNYRTPIGLGAGDRARLQALMGGGGASPAAERKGIGAAYAWFEKRVGPEAGTSNAVARTTPGYMRDRGQFDCFDKTHNATELLALLAHFGLLRHHVIDVPQSRGLLIDLRQHHTTAVIREKVSGKRWSVDGWTHRNGEIPDIFPMEEWAKKD
jgi:hypothetical protein